MTSCVRQITLVESIPPFQAFLESLPNDLLPLLVLLGIIGFLVVTFVKRPTYRLNVLIAGAILVVIVVIVVASGVIGCGGSVTLTPQMLEDQCAPFVDVPRSIEADCLNCNGSIDRGRYGVVCCQEGFLLTEGIVFGQDLCPQED